MNCNMYFFLLKGVLIEPLATPPCISLLHLMYAVARHRAVFLTSHCSPTRAAPKEASCVATASFGHKNFLEAFLPMRSRQAKGS